MTQEQAFKILKSDRSAFITGPAGSGKTHLLKNFISFLKKSGQNVAVTASTGLAATHLNGRTIHSWAGIGIHDSLTQELMAKIAARKSVREQVREAEVLIIDEISMLHDYRLDMVDGVCRLLRKSAESFGGLQVIFSGDFFQLPPVQRENDGQTHFAIHSKAWKEIDPTICYLETIFRQEGDNALSGILNALRENRLEDSHIEALRARQLANPDKSLLELYCHNADIDRINNERLERLPGQARTFWGKRQDLSKNKSLVEQLVKNCLAPEELRLKKDAPVMFVKNDSKRLFINGTIGRIAGWRTANGHPVVKTRAGIAVKTELATWQVEQGGQELAAFHQLPLKLAWAITVHKSQGMTLEGAFIDLSKTFEPGMGYVALSRLKDLENLYLKGFNDKALTMHPEAYAIDRYLQSAQAAF